ncbi:hypothetical protein Avbf_05296 [Armadillidium vulgare]|nr:hypothetical protein Avbf_05296 [Armadillidium vulgare]
MSNLFAYVQFLDDKSRNVVPEDDQANLEKYERSIYEGTILDLGAQMVMVKFIFRKGRWYEYENKIINQKKKIKTLQNEMEVLKSRNAYLETDYDTLKEKLNRYESNAGIEESSCKEMLKNPLQETKIKEMKIIFGSISFPEKPFLTISRRPKHSLFVKDLAFKGRLKKQQYHDAMIALELKLVNRYIVEKINDVKKCKSRRNLNMTYDIQNKNIPREEEKNLSENEPISNDMINYTRIFSLSQLIISFFDLYPFTNPFNHSFLCC